MRALERGAAGGAAGAAGASRCPGRFKAGKIQESFPRARENAPFQGGKATPGSISNPDYN